MVGGCSCARRGEQKQSSSRQREPCRYYHTGDFRELLFGDEGGVVLQLPMHTWWQHCQRNLAKQETAHRLQDGIKQENMMPDAMK